MNSLLRNILCIGVGLFFFFSIGYSKGVHKIDYNVHESIIIDGDIFKLPNLKPNLESSLMVPNSVEGYNILTTGVTLCSQIARLTLERLTGKKSGDGRKFDIPKGDAITLIKQGMKAKQLKEVGVLTGCVQVRESLVGDFIETQVLAGQLTGMKTGELCGNTAIVKLKLNFEKKVAKSKDSIWDIYMYDPQGYGYGKGHRFVAFRGSDNQIYILDPVLGKHHALAKPFSDYFTSIIEHKYGSVLYIGKGYKPKKFKIKN